MRLKKRCLFEWTSLHFRSFTPVWFFPLNRKWSNFAETPESQKSNSLVYLKVWKQIDSLFSIWDLHFLVFWWSEDHFRTLICFIYKFLLCHYLYYYYYFEQSLWLRTARRSTFEFYFLYSVINQLCMLCILLFFLLTVLELLHST